MSQFDKYYYTYGCGGTAYGSTAAWHEKFASIADTIVAELAPRHVLDAGCAMGMLVAALRRRGVEAYGIDISDYAISQVAEEYQPYCRVGSISEPFDQHYDLIISIEVLEHMPADQSEQAIANFCTYSDSVLFSSTPLDFKEVSHVNVRNPEAWAGLFARHGFFRDVDFDASFITPWAVCFRRRNDAPVRLIRDYERRFWELWKETCDLRALAEEQRGMLAQSVAALDALQAQEQARQVALRELQDYVRLLEETVRSKNMHIRDLESLLERIAHGRLMRVLRRFTKS